MATASGLINALIDDETGQTLEYKQLISDPKTKALWSTSAANEFGRLAQGIDDHVIGTDTIKLITVKDLPAGRRPTYGRFVCDIHPQKRKHTEPD